MVEQYDLAHDRQLPDLAKFENDPAMPMVIVMNPRPNGELLISNGVGFITMDRDTGKVLRNYKVEGRGWAAVEQAPSTGGMPMSGISGPARW